VCEPDYVAGRTADVEPGNDANDLHKIYLLQISQKNTKTINY
jgi:hypothetical protein